MKNVLKMVSIATCCCTPAMALAQGQSIASTMDVYVFPAEGQATDQQSKDEATCYEWAVSNSGTDPFELQKQQQAQAEQSQAQMEQAQQAGTGSGAQGALRGAAAGALIGEIASDDAGEGAAWGAAVGLIHGRRKARAQQEQAVQQAEQQAASAQQASAQQIENFKNAFSLCLEAKDYMVKY